MIPLSEHLLAMRVRKKSGNFGLSETFDGETLILFGTRARTLEDCEQSLFALESLKRTRTLNFQ